jgi:dipeptidyl aminopeptidase/acylaminoacyl peptidase
MICLAQLAAASALSGAEGKRPMTVAAAIETTRIVPPKHQASSKGTDVLVSPDGSRWVAMLVRGDLGRNGNWIELISGRLDRPGDSPAVTRVARLFTASLGTVGFYGRETWLTFMNPLVWLDNERVAFLFSDGREPIQVYSVNVRTHRVTRMTRHATNITEFTLGPAGAMLYVAQTNYTSARNERLMKTGFAVTNAEAFGFLAGNIDGYGYLDQVQDGELFLLKRGERTPKRIAVSGDGVDRFIPLITPAFSPDGRYVVVDGTPDAIAPEWGAYTDEFTQLSFRESQRNRLGGAARQLKQLFIVDLRALSSRPLWPAPIVTLKTRQVVWSPNGKSVLIGRTFLPVGSGIASSPEGLKGDAVVAIDPVTGAFSQIPVPADHADDSLTELAWLDESTIKLGFERAPLFFEKADGSWVPVSRGESSDTPTPQTKIIVRQDANTPPTLHEIDTARGTDRLILDPNPNLLSDYTLGRVEPFKWRDDEGREWSGLLYHPVHEAPERRFPLVIQTHGHAPATQFSLYGMGSERLSLGLGPMYSVYAAQALANRDIAVLQVEDRDESGIDITPAEPRMYMHGYEAAIGHLVAQGLVDRDKVGLVGFSRTGWHVEFALSHSPFPYAAALTSDNYDGSYMRALLLWSDEFERNIGAMPSGKGLERWFAESPAFNADRIHTPLRLQSESPGVFAALAKWEMFMQLRLLNKPVELYLIPDIEHGSHNVQNPAQCYAAQQGAVDWFDFWLNGYEDADPRKAEQYTRWRKLRGMQQDLSRRR